MAVGSYTTRRQRIVQTAAPPSAHSHDKLPATLRERPVPHPLGNTLHAFHLNFLVRPHGSLVLSWCVERTAKKKTTQQRARPPSLRLLTHWAALRGKSRLLHTGPFHHPTAIRPGGEEPLHKQRKPHVDTIGNDCIVKRARHRRRRSET